MNAHVTPATAASPAYKNAPTRTVSADGVDFAHRRLGPDGGTPLILLNHLGAVLDNWDPRVVDGLAAHRHVIAFDNRGIGATGGATPRTVAEMAQDAVRFIRALGLPKVDLLGFSLGGFVAQAVAQEHPELVRRIILAGTGPAGGEGIDKVTGLTVRLSLKAVLTRRDPKQNLFFTGSTRGRRAGAAFIQRLKERTHDRDKPIALPAFRAQLAAIRRWGLQAPDDLSSVRHPALVANGESDRMVPSRNTLDLAARLPNAQLVPLYPDAGHGGIFQYHDDFVAKALAFLQTPDDQPA
ncbi:MAG: alpha/beta hydrolase [Streptomyces sp.]|jgi:pimeloyl-ACP methyl ester carboxylesterase|nr:alpha/beta hydrolase [Streptomyces sp.]